MISIHTCCRKIGDPFKFFIIKSFFKIFYYNIIAIDWGYQENVLERGSRLVVVASSRWVAEGHDSLIVHTAEP